MQSSPRTYCLADAGVPGLGYPSHEGHAGQGDVAAQAHEHVPALEADSDRAESKGKTGTLSLADVKQGTAVLALLSSTAAA